MSNSQKKRKTHNQTKRTAGKYSSVVKTNVEKQHEKKFLKFITALKFGDLKLYTENIVFYKKEVRALIHADSIRSGLILCLLHKKISTEGDQWLKNDNGPENALELFQDYLSVTKYTQHKLTAEIKKAEKYFGLSTEKANSSETEPAKNVPFVFEKKTQPKSLISAASSQRASISSGVKVRSKTQEQIQFVLGTNVSQKQIGKTVKIRKQNFGPLFQTLLSWDPVLNAKIFRGFVQKRDHSFISNKEVNELFGIRFIRLISFLRVNHTQVEDAINANGGKIFLLSKSIACFRDPQLIITAKKLLQDCDISEKKWTSLNNLYEEEIVGPQVKKRKAAEFAEWLSLQSLIKRKYSTVSKSEGVGVSESPFAKSSDKAKQGPTAEPDPHYKEALGPSIVNIGDSYRSMLADMRRDERSPINPSNKSLKPQKQSLITVRQGQQSFRELVLQKYQERCAISGCEIVEVLQAAHIVDYSISKDHSVTNGICLRVDLHQLFDRGYVLIDENYTIFVDKIIKDPIYQAFNSKTLNLPRQQIDWPKRENLLWKFTTVLGDKVGLTTE